MPDLKATPDVQLSIELLPPKKLKEPLPPLLSKILTLRNDQLVKNASNSDAATARRAEQRSERVQAEMKHLLRKEEAQAQWTIKFDKQREAQEASNAALQEKRQRRNVEDRAGMGELTETRDHLQAWARERGLLRKAKYESDADFRARIDNLTAYLDKMFQTHKGKIETESLRYVEGFPVRDRMKRPALFPDRLTGCLRAKCLQCDVRQMRCSLEMGGVRGEACSVCRRHGEGDECCFWQQNYGNPIDSRFILTKQQASKTQKDVDEVARKWHRVRSCIKLDAFNGALQECWTASFALPRSQHWDDEQTDDLEDDRQKTGEEDVVSV
ncbi:uncharacterized protein J7T54_002649 [Emericellopsis cladophorae]|uniref:Uncharacterized protein n=1 Tax=Emericellopsis cladophorae TaxID=2686198 RepID=A0A9Q0BC77_9HYPO|nr:uncharacterized protein J7T54_002649 [Emericellopsis cladophorae]KAI6778819.1 hypothetical protein J7T54_002649 [Emericellopsis cladophorae]